MLKSGDSVTLSVSPTIAVTQYDRLKPHASLTRVIESEDDLQEMRQDLVDLCAKALAIEVECLMKAHDELEDCVSIEDVVEKYRPIIEKEAGIGHEEDSKAKPKPSKVGKAKGSAKTKVPAKFKKGGVKRKPVKKGKISAS